MGYVLEPLLRIRTMREDRAAGELTAAKRATAEARDALARKVEELERFNETKDLRKDKLWEAIIGHEVSRDRIDLMEEGLAQIDEERNLKADSVHRAEGEVQKREEAEAVARGNFTVATRNRMKIDEHKDVWRKAELAVEELRTEGELEDFVVRKEEL